MMSAKGLAEENAQKLCAYIGRQAGKIKRESMKKNMEDALKHMEEAMASKTMDEMREHMRMAMGMMKDQMGMMGMMGSEMMEDEEEHEDKEMMNKSSFTVKKNEDGSVDWQIDFAFQKLNDEERLVGGIVYEPDVVDSQGDSAGPDEIRKAAHRFMQDSATLGIMHKEKAEKRAQIVETFVVPEAFRIGKHVVKKGSWFMVVKIHDDGLWGDVKSNKITGFSMAGRAHDDAKQ